jgi:hypothetical protein
MFDLHHIHPLAAVKSLRLNENIVNQLAAAATSKQFDDNNVCEVCSKPVIKDIPFPFPVVILAASHDIVCPPEMSIELYDALKIPKLRFEFPGDHNR